MFFLNSGTENARKCCEVCAKCQKFTLMRSGFLCGSLWSLGNSHVKKTWIFCMHFTCAKGIGLGSSERRRKGLHFNFCSILFNFSRMFACVRNPRDGIVFVSFWTREYSYSWQTIAFAFKINSNIVAIISWSRALRRYIQVASSRSRSTCVFGCSSVTY